LESSFVLDDIESVESKPSFGNGDVLIAERFFDLVLLDSTEWSGDDLAQRHALVEVAEIQACGYVAFFESRKDTDFLLVLPVAVLRVEERMKGGLVHSAEWWSYLGVGDASCHAGVNVKPERYTSVAVGVVAPENGVVPTLAEAQDSIAAGNLFFPVAKAPAERWVGLCYGPQFKRIIEIVEGGYL
jgi:hypothetical protein